MLLLLTITFFLNIQAQKFESFTIKEGVFEVNTDQGKYVIQPYTSHAFHTAFYPSDLPIKQSAFAICQLPENMDVQVEESAKKIALISEGIQVEITKEPLSITYILDNQTLFSIEDGYAASDTSQALSLQINDKEVLYGGGERVLGMNRRGHRLEIYNRAHYGYTTHSELMNYAIPMYLSSKKYAVLFDNASHAFLDLDSQKNNTVTYEAFGGTLNFYVFANNDWYTLLKNYTALTGRQPMPPRWAFGNFSSRFGYRTQEETLSTIQHFIDDDIPVDAIILDLYWFGAEIFGHMGKLDWDTTAFPSPQKMIDKLKSQGVKTVLITEPFILTTSTKWDEAVRKNVLGTKHDGTPYTYDFYFGNTGLVDVFKLSARRWFWDIYKKHTLSGVEGWWGDLGEPEVHPADLQHVNGSAEEVHNAYGHEWAGIIYEGYQKDFPEKRPFILMRSGFAGSQRYGIIPWTGDVSRSWGGLIPQPEISLQMGMQGVAYTHSDLGGFAGGDSLDTELYTRWLQYGVFQPIFRPHAQHAIPSEPVFMPEETKASARESIKLRYKLLPYIYNMAYENHVSGKPLMIPLLFEEPENEKMLTYDQAYLWGDNFLVSPVKERGKKHQDIYLPKGNAWFNFFTDEKFDGGQTITQTLVKDYIPVYARGGSFIPMKEKGENTESYNLNDFEMHFFADESVATSSYKLYNDDGKTPEADEKGIFETLEFQSTNNLNHLSLKASSMQGKKFKASDKKEITYKIHGLSEKPKGVSSGNEKLKGKYVKWDKASKILSVLISVEDGNSTTIAVEK